MNTSSSPLSSMIALAWCSAVYDLGDDRAVLIKMHACTDRAKPSARSPLCSADKVLHIHCACSVSHAASLSKWHAACVYQSHCIIDTAGSILMRRVMHAWQRLWLMLCNSHRRQRAHVRFTSKSSAHRLIRHRCKRRGASGWHCQVQQQPARLHFCSSRLLSRKQKTSHSGLRMQLH